MGEHSLELMKKVSGKIGFDYPWENHNGNPIATHLSFPTKDGIEYLNSMRKVMAYFSYRKYGHMASLRCL